MIFAVTRGVRDEVDQLLAPLLGTSDEVQARHHIETLLIQHAQPIIRGVINKTVYRLGGEALAPANVQDIQEVEDLVSQVYLRLIHTLRHLSFRSDDAVIRSFPSYVATVSQNVCNSYLREKWPRRYRLKNRACYILSSDARFAIWEDSGAGRVCGLAEWRSKGIPAAAEQGIREVRDMNLPAAVSPDAPASEVATLIHELLCQTGAPVRIDDLVTVLAKELGITDRSADRAVRPAPHQHHRSQGDTAEEIAESAEQRLRLRWMWIEIEQLPRSQRAALLLALRDEHGDSLLRFLSDEKIVTMQEAARSLDIAASELAAIWEDLPLDDGRIAGLLGVERKRIATFRQAARRRLARRVAHQRTEARQHL
jgi:hypothetical protein